MVFIGSNIKREVPRLHEEFRAYYAVNGVKFKSTQPLSNIKEFIHEQILDGVDYMIKQAHSGGDENNVVIVDRRGTLYTGTRKLPDGRSETVYLIAPLQTDTHSDIITNREFGEWLREREARGKGQIAYINTSCWSNHKARKEIAEAQTSILLEIPLETVGRTFKAINQSGTAIVVDSLRNGKTYKEFRIALEADPGYAKHHSNVYIFPDEQIY